MLIAPESITVAQEFLGSISPCCTNPLIQSIWKTHSYVYPHPEPPEPPEISFNTTTNVFCFGSGGYHVEYYLVSVVDITGSPTSLSGTYTSPQCIKLTSDLYTDVCL